MNNLINVNLKMDLELKKNMEIICEEMGLTMETAFIIFCKTVVREGKIPFEAKTD